jgi:diaminopimelate decarboxylase
MSTEELVTLFEKLPTPFYYYDLDLLRETLRRVQKAAGRYGYHIHYALKANADRRVLQFMREAGLGADCVSGNEVTAAVAAGFDPATIFFAGVGKTDREILTALENGIGAFNVESLEELQVIERLAQERGVSAPVSIRINPLVDAHTHRHITTGIEVNKFGILAEDLDPVIDLLRGSLTLVFKGIHVHIGSQITDLEVFRRLAVRVNELGERFAGAGLPVQTINLGGGLGVDYRHPEQDPVPDFEAFFRVIHDTLHTEQEQEVHFELGRSLVAQMGDLITRVIYLKRSSARIFVIIDAGMSDLIRPALYETVHRIENLSARHRGKNAETLRVDVVGPICETADTFARNIPFPHTIRGDILAIRSAGAYGKMMSSSYNLRDATPVVYSDEL